MGGGVVALGVILKLTGSFFWAYRFILLKKIDKKFDEICDQNDDLKRSDLDKIRAKIDDQEIYFKGKKLHYFGLDITLWESELFQLMTIPLNLMLDTGLFFSFFFCYYFV